jgi:peptidoglycan/LPS O-acetylase OafA/YrhL
MTTMKSRGLDTYRPDIDGLRAIAVLAVIAFHASARILPGGFVGVDVFFVISGYLITGLIVKAIDEDRFSFAEFYTRRIKRIFPAYIAVALFTLAVSTYLLIPNDYIFFTTSLATSWGFVSNVFFSMLSWGYFGGRTEEFPLLHTWSLSVEEQFYFIFPVLLILLSRHLKKNLVHALAILCIGLVMLSQWKTGELKSYFLLTTRAHELLVGALTFFASRRFPLADKQIANLLVILGMSAVIASMILFNRGVPFPGFNSLVPAIGTAFIIYACQTENHLSPLLKNRLMVYIGLISYSLYLWHWPIFTFLRYRKIELDLAVGIAAVALSFLLAHLSWKFIETPVRQNKTIRFKKAFLQIYAVPAAAFLSIGIYSYLTEGAPQRFSGDMRELISSYSYERDLSRSCAIRAEDYRKVNVDYLLDRCAFGDEKQKKAEVLLVGDSHADHFKPFVDRLAHDAGMKAVFHVQGTCRPTDLPATGVQSAATASTCTQRNADLLALAGNFRYVVLAGFWSDYRNADLETELSRAVEKITRAGATPVIFKDNASHEPDLSRCVLYKKRGWLDEDKDCHIPYRLVATNEGPIDAMIDRVKKRHPRTLIVDPKRIMCTATECATYINNTALYKDSNHINSIASGMLGEQYIARIGNPFKEPKPVFAKGETGNGVQVRYAESEGYRMATEPGK